MSLFNFEDFALGAKTYIDQRVTPLKKPANSEFFYLTELLSEDDVAFECEYVKAYSPSVQYKVTGHYNSTLKKSEPKKSTTYSSSTSLSYLDGFLVERSENWSAIPEELLKRDNYSSRPIATQSVEELIKKDATAKIRNKVRRAGEHIEADDIYEIEINHIGESNEEKEVTHFSLVWARIIRKSDGALIGHAHKFNGFSAVFEFIPDETKAGLDHSLKPVKQPKPPKPKKVKKKSNLTPEQVGERIGEYIGQAIVGIIIAAAILLVEFAGIFIYNKGAVDKLEPGVYTITTENYEDFLRVMDSRSDSITSGEKRTDNLTFVNIGENNEISLMWLAPRTTQFRLFDMTEKSSYSRSSKDVEKYVITNLKIVFEFTYSFGGELYSETVEETIPLIEGVDWKDIKISIPSDAIEQSSILGQSIGAFHSTFEFWRVDIVSVSGVAEAREVK